MNSRLNHRLEHQYIRGNTMKRTELQEMIRGIVKEELKEHTKQVKKYVKAYVPMIIGEAVGAFLEDKLEEVESVTPSRKTLKESLELDEFETIGKRPVTTKDRSSIANSSKLAAMMGYGESTVNENTVDQVITDSGVAVPVDNSQVPDHLRSALNRNYSDFLKAMDNSSQTYRSQNRR